jgi:hypothetical protein
MDALEEAICRYCRRPAYFLTREETAAQIEALLRDAWTVSHEHRGLFLDSALTTFARNLRMCVRCSTALEAEKANAACEDISLGLELVK